MNETKLTTEFAPPERANPDEIKRQYEKLTKSPVTTGLIKGFPQLVVILNKYRQIILANEKLLELLKKKEEEILGLRPGEALACIYAKEGPAGCGTTKFCRYCGAVKAILNSQKKGKQDVQECELLSGSHRNITANNLRIWATPLELEGENFTVFAINDISGEKLHTALERIFFHDILNTAGGIQGVMEIMPFLEEEEVEEFQREGHYLSKQLVAEIRTQRDLKAAEQGNLLVQIKELNVSDLLSSIQALYKHHRVSKEKHIKICNISNAEKIETDEVILTRILGNLVKNALEASNKGQVVTIAYEKEKKNALFSVHNETAMPEKIKLQLFKRFFSTKGGKGRGIGTYSVKLLTEKYLNGTVSFSSTEEEGTTFTIRLPHCVL